MTTRVPGYFLDYFSNYKAIILLVVVPLLALIPDFTLKFLQKIYFLPPAEIINRIENNKAQSIEMFEKNF